MARLDFRMRRSALISVSFLALAACGGSGGGDGGFDEIATIAASPGGSGTLGSYFMQTITDEWRAAAAAVRQNSRYIRQQNDWWFVDGNGNQISPTYSSYPLASSHFDFAHAVGLSGRGKTVAVVDGGFRAGHEVFDGTSITRIGSLTVGDATDIDHGTAVASIISGSSSRMVGVAPDANLILSTYYGDVAAATNQARIRGAVAQNNSWGFPSLGVDQASFDSFFGDAQGQAYLAALDAYAAQGVVVFAVSNDDTASNATLMEGLPALRPSLESGWIAVGNAVPTMDFGDWAGNVSSLQRQSAPCAEAARWCIFADGSWRAATGRSDSSYASGMQIGTSFAAPQVSGALALLAEAFPTLTPHELRTRLLASADNSFAEFVSAGQVDLDEGAGVYLHDYSDTFGHGFLDVRAALLPIGTPVVMTATGTAVAMDDLRFATGTAMGDAITRELADVRIAVTDSLGGGFGVEGTQFAGSIAPQPLAASVSARALNKNFRAARVAPLSPLADIFAAHPGETLDLNAPDGETKAAVLLGGSDGSYGLALSRTLTEGDLKLDVGLKVARDDGSVMGFSDAGGGSGADMVSLTLGIGADDGTSFFGLSGEIGVADLGAPSAMFGDTSARFDSVRLDMGGRSVLARDDRLALGIAMPVAVSGGKAEMTVPVALASGRSEMRSFDVDLAPSARQVDLSLSYQVPMSESSEMLFEIVHAENYGNRAGYSDTAAVIGMKWEF